MIDASIELPGRISKIFQAGVSVLSTHKQIQEQWRRCLFFFFLVFGHRQTQSYFWSQDSFGFALLFFGRRNSFGLCLRTNSIQVPLFFGRKVLFGFVFIFFFGRRKSFGLCPRHACPDSVLCCAQKPCSSFCLPTLNQSSRPFPGVEIFERVRTHPPSPFIL